jgi:hypothetical protein
MDAVELMRTTPHNFHPSAKGEPWGLQQRSLERLNDLTARAQTTFESGLGESTVVFLANAGRHIAVAPDADEYRAIDSFCQQYGIPTDGFEFHQGVTERVLPSLELPPLDVVLIDGQHAFPVPFLDWFFTADHLRQGGLLFLDDVGIRTGKVLKEFLLAEPEWRLREDLVRSCIFEKTVEGAVTNKWWKQQPWCHPQSAPSSPLERLRMRVRLRARLRGLVQR